MAGWRCKQYLIDRTSSLVAGSECFSRECAGKKDWSLKETLWVRAEDFYQSKSAETLHAPKGFLFPPMNTTLAFLNPFERKTRDLTPLQRADQIAYMVGAMQGTFAQVYNDTVPEKNIKAELNEQLPDIILELRRLREQINGRDWRRVK